MELLFMEMLYLRPVLQFGKKLILLLFHKSSAKVDVMLYLELMSEADLLEVEGGRVLMRIHLMMTNENISEILLDDAKNTAPLHPRACSPRLGTLD